MRRLGSSPHWAIVGAMCLALALVATVGLGTRALERIGAAQEATLAQERIARVLAPEGPAGLTEARAAFARSPDVREARVVTAQEAAALLSGWAEGESLPADSLANLRLVALKLNANAPEDIAERLQADLAEQGVSVEISGPGPAARSAVRRTGADRFGILSLASAVVAAALVGFAARAGAAGQATTARLLTSLGATRSQALSLMARPIAGAGFFAGLLGAVLALAVWAGIAAAAPEARALLPSPNSPITLADVVPLIAAPVIGFFAARSGARAGAGRAFDTADFAP